MVEQGLVAQVHLVEPRESRQRELAKLDKGVVHACELKDLTGIDDGAVDVVVAMNVLHFMPDLGQALRHLNRLSRDGGVLMGSFVLEGHTLLEQHPDPASFHLRSVDEIQKELELAGFHLVQWQQEEGPGHLLDGTEVENAPMFNFAAKKTSRPKDREAA